MRAEIKWKQFWHRIYSDMHFYKNTYAVLVGRTAERKQPKLKRSVFFARISGLAQINFHTSVYGTVVKVLEIFSCSSSRPHVPFLVFSPPPLCSGRKFLYSIRTRLKQKTLLPLLYYVPKSVKFFSPRRVVCKFSF